MLVLLAYLKLLRTHYKEISIWKGYLKAVKLKITTAAFLLDMTNKIMYYIRYVEVW